MSGIHALIWSGMIKCSSLDVLALRVLGGLHALAWGVIVWLVLARRAASIVRQRGKGGGSRGGRRMALPAAPGSSVGTTQTAGCGVASVSTPCSPHRMRRISARMSTSHRSVKSVKSVHCDEVNSGTTLQAWWNCRHQNMCSTMWARRRALAHKWCCLCSRSSSVSARIAAQLNVATIGLSCRNSRMPFVDQPTDYDELY